MTQDKKAPKLRFKGFTDDWEHQSFFDLATFNKGKGYTKRDITSIGTPIFLYGSLYTQYQEIISNIKTFTTHKISNAVISSGDEVVLPDSGETADDISRAAYINKSGIILGGGLLVVHPDKTLLNPAYLAYSLTYGTNHKLLSSKAQGKSIVHIHLADLEKLKIRFPEVNEQIKIAKTLNLFNQTIKTQQRKLDQLKLLKKGLLQKMFADEKSKVPEIRFKGFNGEWEQCKLKDIVIKIHAGTNLLGSPTNNGIPLLKMGNIQRGYWDLSNTQFLSKNDIPNSNDFIKANEFYFNTRNTLLLVGKGATWLGKSGTYAYNNNIAHVTFDFNKVNNTFFNYLYNTSRIISRINSKAAGTTSVAALYPKDFLSLNIIKPNINEQNYVSGLLRNLDKNISTQQQKLTQLQQVKKFLLQNMFI